MPEFLPKYDQPKDPSAPQSGEGRIIDSEVWLKRVFESDPRQGCSLLYRLYYSPLFSHSLRFVYSRVVAEDIVAEVFCRFWEDRIFERVKTSYRAYLAQCVRHASYTYVKSEFGRKTAIEDLPPFETTAYADDMLQYDELNQLMEETIDRLPPQCKRVFVLSRIENQKHADIAVELGISTKAVEKHITKALRILRKKLESDWSWS